MPDVSTIPNASDLQLQLAAIERGIASLKAGAEVMAIGISAPPMPPPTGDGSSGVQEVPVATRIELYPWISDPESVQEIIKALEKQHAALVAELESWGYSYTGSATPPDTAPSSTAQMPKNWMPLAMPNRGTPVFTPPPPPQNLPTGFMFTPEPVPPPQQEPEQHATPPVVLAPPPVHPVHTPPNIPPIPAPSPQEAAASAAAAQAATPAGPTHFDVTVEPRPAE